ncbi:hypothetical protein EJB05_27269, partial [Eragrostis curvula]
MGREGGDAVQDLEQKGVERSGITTTSASGFDSPSCRVFQHQMSGLPFEILLPKGFMDISESSTTVRGRGKNKRKWFPAEDDELIKALHDISLDPRSRSDGSFKNGYTSVLEARLAESFLTSLNVSWKRRPAARWSSCRLAVT